MGGYHRPVCGETGVGPLHYFSVEGWGRQQHPYSGNVLEYGSICLYVASIISFCFPHVVYASDLSICIVLCAFVLCFPCVCCM